MTRERLRILLVAVLLFTGFLLLRIPYNNIFGHVYQWVYKNTGIYISSEHTSLNLLGWPGFKLKKFVLALPMAGSELEVSGEQMVARVGIGGIFPPRYFISGYFSNLKKGGTGYLKFYQPKDSYDASLDFNQIELTQLHPHGIQRIFSGMVSLRGYFSFSQEDPTLSSGNFQIELKDFKLLPQNLQGIVIPAINFGTCHSKINIRNGVVDLGNLKFGDKAADLEANLSGEVRLNKELSHSFLSLVLKIHLSEEFSKSPGADTILSFLSTYKTSEPNQYAMKWNSSFIEMTSNVLKAIPQRL